MARVGIRPDRCRSGTRARRCPCGVFATRPTRPADALHCTPDMLPADRHASAWTRRDAEGRRPCSVDMFVAIQGLLGPVVALTARRRRPSDMLATAGNMMAAARSGGSRHWTRLVAARLVGWAGCWRCSPAQRPGALNMFARALGRRTCSPARRICRASAGGWPHGSNRPRADMFFTPMEPPGGAAHVCPWPEPPDSAK